MALSIIISTTPRSSTGVNTIIASTTTSGVFKFRYHLRVEYWISGELLTKSFAVTQPRNNAGLGIFNMTEIYKNIVTPMITTKSLRDSKDSGIPSLIVPIHNMPFDHTDGTDTKQQYLYSRPYMNDSAGWDSFQGNCNKALLTFREMYSTTSGGIPTIQGSAVTKSQYVFWGRFDRDDNINTPLNTKFNLTAPTKNFLTNNYKFDLSTGVGRYIGYIGRNQLMTMAFQNGHVSGAFDVDTYGVLFRYYNSSGIEIGNLLAKNEKDSGGKYGGTDGQLNSGRSFFMTIGAGLENLDDVTTSYSYYVGDTPEEAETSSGDSISYYEMYMINSSSNRISNIYKFNVTTPCDRYEETRLAYINKYGCWEYINLNKKRKTTYKVKKDTILKPLLHSEVPANTTDEGEANNIFPPTMPHQGTMVTSISVDEDMSLFTQNLDDTELARIQDLILSPQIHMASPNANSSSWVALICTTTKIDTKTKGESKLYSYELKFKFAEPKFRTT